MYSSIVKMEKLKLFNPLKRRVRPGNVAMTAEMKSRQPVSKFIFFFLVKNLVNFVRGLEIIVDSLV